MMKYPQMDEYTRKDGTVDANAFVAATVVWHQKQRVEQYKKELMSEFGISEKDWEASPKSVINGLIDCRKNWLDAEGHLESARSWIEDAPI